MLTALFTALLISNPAGVPLLGQVADHGFTMPQNQLREFCSVFADRVEITIQDANSVIAILTKPITLEADLAGLVAAAARGPIEREVGPTDIPARARFAVVQENDTISHIDLGKEVSGQRTVNHSPEAGTLRRILEHLCASPETL